MNEFTKALSTLYSHPSDQEHMARSIIDDPENSIVFTRLDAAAASITSLLIEIAIQDERRMREAGESDYGNPTTARVFSSIESQLSTAKEEGKISRSSHD